MQFSLNSIASIQLTLIVLIAFGACEIPDDDPPLDEPSLYSFSADLTATMSALGCEAHASGDIGACFTRYDISSDNDRIVRLIEYLLKTADANTDVKISIFHWIQGTDSDLDQALFDTQAGSVEFIIEEADHNLAVVDHLVGQEGYQRCGDVDNDDNHNDYIPCTAPRWVQTCVNGCATHGETKRSQHSKLFLFRNHPMLVGSNDDLVVVTSTNVNPQALRNSQNAMVLASQDSSGSLFRWIKSRFRQLERHEWPARGRESWSGELYPGGADVFGFWTHAPNDFDAWAHIANRISSTPGNAEIYIGMSSWSAENRPAIGSRLDTLAKSSGADYDVKIVLQTPANQSDLRASLSNIPDSNIFLGAVPNARVHDKFLALEGTYEGLASKYVFSGSHTMTNKSRRSDDVIVGVRSSWLYNRFVRHFNTLTP